MKRGVIVLLSILVAACGQSPKNRAAESAARPDGVEVLSFHTQKRCPTCLAIERLTREVVETEFASRLADSSLILRVVDISREEALADRYEVTWSSLFVNRHRDGVETTADLTRFAFANARTNPEKFKAGLKAEIEKALVR